MGSTRRAFTDEYESQAVGFVIEGGRSVAEVARNIGVHEMTLGKWVKKARDEEESSLWATMNPATATGPSPRPPRGPPTA